VAEGLSPASLGSRAVRGSAWAAAGSYLSFAASFAATAGMARYCRPEDFGVFALAQAYSQGMMAVLGLAFGQAIIQAPTTLVNAQATGFWLTLLHRLIVAAFAVPLAIWVAARHGGVVALPFGQLVALQVLEGMRACVAASLERELRYRALSSVNLLAVVGAGITGVLMAASGWGAQSLLAREMVVVVTSAIGLLVLMKMSGWAVQGRMCRETAGNLWRFARSLYLVRATDQVALRLDRLLLGNMLSLGALAQYHQAKYLSSLSAVAVAPANQQVAIVTLSRVRGDKDRTERAFDTVQYFVLRSLVPLALIMALEPLALMENLYGAQWRPAAPIIRLLAPVVVLGPMLETYRTLLTANEDWRWLRMASVVQFVVLGATLAALSGRWGGEGAAVSTCLGLLVGLGMNVPRATKWISRTCHGQPVGALIAGILGMAGAQTGKSILNLGPLGTIALGVGVYAFALLWWEGRALVERVRRIAHLVRG